MKLISTIHNYLVNGLSLPLNVEVEVTDEESVYLLTLEGVKKAFNDILKDEVVETKVVKTKTITDKEN